MESFPSEVRVEKADVFKATGKLNIDTIDGVEDIRGSLDVALTAMGWRGYAGLRIRQLNDGHGGTVKASLGSMRLEWPTMFPVFGTGIGAQSLKDCWRPIPVDPTSCQARGSRRRSGWKRLRAMS